MVFSGRQPRSSFTALLLLVHILETLPTCAAAISSSELQSTVSAEARCYGHVGDTCGVELRQLRIAEQHIDAEATKSAQSLNNSNFNTHRDTSNISRRFSGTFEVTLGSTNASMTDMESNPDVEAVVQKDVTFVGFFAEFVGTMFYVFIGCGSVMSMSAHEPTEGDGHAEGSGHGNRNSKGGNGNAILQTACAFGFAMAVLSYATFHYSGGQMNVAVTMALVIHGKCNAVQGLLNFLAQMMVTCCGAGLLTVVYPPEKDPTGMLASNMIKPGWSRANALAAEMIMTLLLVFVVLETATNPMAAANRELASLAIGLVVFLAHLVLVPVDGCSINPTRSFGPAFIARMHYTSKYTFLHMWVFWVGPLLGSLMACTLHAIFRSTAFHDLKDLK